DQAGRGQRGGVDFGDVVREAGKDADIDDGDLRAEVGLIEAAMRELAVKGHLAAFKAGADAAARAGGLALAAATGGLAVTVAATVADAFFAMGRARSVGEFVEFHK